MSSLKVSLTFLDGSVASVITKCRHIANSMTGNKYFPIPPITPTGLQTMADDLKALEGKAKGGRHQDIVNRDVVLADLQDFINQNAVYVEHACKNDLEILLSSGFDVKEIKAASNTILS